MAKGLEALEAERLVLEQAIAKLRGGPSPHNGLVVGAEDPPLTPYPSLNGWTPASLARFAHDPDAELRLRGKVARILATGKCGKVAPFNSGMRCTEPRRHEGLHVAGWGGDKVSWADTLDRGQMFRRLMMLAEREVPVSGARQAANWTRDTRAHVPEELIDVWCALQDWVDAGSPAYGGWPSDKGDPYVRLVAALTRFYNAIRYPR